MRECIKAGYSAESMGGCDADLMASLMDDSLAGGY